MKKQGAVLMTMVALLLAGCDLDLVNGSWESNVQGSGISQSESREIDEFSAIKCMIGADITVKHAERPALSITADDNLLSIITTEVHNGMLIVSAEESYSTRTTVRIQIEVPMISRVEVLGSADVLLDSVTEKKLELAISGSGDIEAIGQVQTLDVHINGSGDLKLERLQAQACRIRINGSGDAVLSVADSLDARINGSGDITYYGNPERVNSKVNGSGTIAKR
jgi:hypothetical protein